MMSCQKGNSHEILDWSHLVKDCFLSVAAMLGPTKTEVKNKPRLISAFSDIPLLDVKHETL